MMSDSEPIKVAVLGASGYSGSELIRILLNHQKSNLVCVTSRAESGKSISDVFPRLRGHNIADSLCFEEPTVENVIKSGAKIVFLALPHGVAANYAVSLLEEGIRVIDLSADFRIKNPSTYKEFYGETHPAPEKLEEAVYGLPEIRPEEISKANLLASPGCYPTSILLPLLPLLKSQLVESSSIHVVSMSGTSGAGKTPSVQLLFAECNESVRAYSVPKHRHLSEIEQELSIAAGETISISFTPVLVPITAGIASVIYVTSEGITNAKDIHKILESAYSDCPFVRILDEGITPDTKNVKGTNYIDIGYSYDQRTNRIILMSAEDNLIKGASGQAIQSFNLMCGFDIQTGLNL